MLRLCARLPWVIITPLGSLVEPDVYWRKAKSEDFGDDGRPLLLLLLLMLLPPFDDCFFVLLLLVAFLLSVVIHSNVSGHVPPRGRLNLVMASLTPANFLR